VFSDTRVSTKINGITYYLRDGYKKVRSFGDKIVFCMGCLPVAERVFEQIKPNDQVDDIRLLVEKAFNEYDKSNEIAFYILTVDGFGRYVLHTISDKFDFEIKTDVIKNRDIMAAGANSDKALDFASELIGKMPPFEIIKKSYDHVSDEKVGGHLILHEMYVDDNLNVMINKRVLQQIKDIRPLRSIKSYASLDGLAKFRRLQITDENNTALIDSTTRKFYLNNWDLEGAGIIDARLIQAGTMTIDSGFINDLTVTRLKTLDKSDQIGHQVDFVEAQDNYISFKTGIIVGRQQAITPEGFPLYWTDDTKTQLTTESTLYPFYNLTYEPIEKLKIYLEGQGIDSYPIIQLGAGDGIIETSGKGYIIKPAGKLDILYYSKNYGKERRVTLDDSGIEINVGVNDQGIFIKIGDNGEITVEGQNINVKASQNINFDAPIYNFI
jgi:hypothetical protein